MRATWLAIAMLGSTALLFAQDVESGTSDQTEKKSPEQIYKQLVAATNKARGEWFRKGQKSGHLDQAADPVHEFAPRFERYAKKYAGTPAAVQFLVWLATNNRTPEKAQAAFDTLIAEHKKSEFPPKTIGYCHYYARTLGRRRVRKALEALVEVSPHQRVRAEAHFALGQMLLEADNRAGADSNADAESKARAHLEAAVKLGKGEWVGASAEGVLFERDHLVVGKTAPDIEGKDLDGVAFKLSDYRGKVVVLDFWGDW